MGTGWHHICANLQLFSHHTFYFAINKFSSFAVNKICVLLQLPQIYFLLSFLPNGVKITLDTRAQRVFTPYSWTRRIIFWLCALWEDPLAPCVLNATWNMLLCCLQVRHHSEVLQEDTSSGKALWKSSGQKKWNGMSRSRISTVLSRIHGDPSEIWCSVLVSTRNDRVILDSLIVKHTIWLSLSSTNNFQKYVIHKTYRSADVFLVKANWYTEHIGTSSFLVNVSGEAVSNF